MSLVDITAGIDTVIADRGFDFIAKPVHPTGALIVDERFVSAKRLRYSCGPRFVDHVRHRCWRRAFHPYSATDEENRHTERYGDDTQRAHLRRVPRSPDSNGNAIRLRCSTATAGQVRLRSAGRGGTNSPSLLDSFGGPSPASQLPLRPDKPEDAAVPHRRHKSRYGTCGEMVRIKQGS
jgi:hypothetical protein